MEVSELSERVEGEKKKYKCSWRESCEQLKEYDDIVAEKEAEIADLRARLEALETEGSGPRREETVHSPTLGDSVPRPLGVPCGPVDTSTRTTSSTHRGKAPPVDQFDGESAEVRFDDWFPMLQRTAKWNGWSDEESSWLATSGNGHS